MVEAATIERPAIRALFPLDGRYHAAAGVALTPTEPRALVALHLDADDFGAAGNALGVGLPRKANRSENSDTRAALWLGPDDILVLARDGEAEAMVAAIEEAAPAASAVDVSDRIVGIAVDGAAAEAVLAAGCPRDLSLDAFPVGACARTVFSRAELTLWRRGETRFEVFTNRSFADYLWAYLVDASRAPAV